MKHDPCLALYDLYRMPQIHAALRMIRLRIQNACFVPFET